MLFHSNISLLIFLHLKGFNDFFSGPISFSLSTRLLEELTYACSPLLLFYIYSSASADFHSKNCLQQAHQRLNTAKHSPCIKYLQLKLSGGISCASFEELLHPTLELRRTSNVGCHQKCGTALTAKTPCTRRNAGWG